MNRLRQIHIQEFRALVDRAARILADTHCGTVEVSKEKAVEWAEKETSPLRIAYKEQPPCFIILAANWLVIGTRPEFPTSTRIEKQKVTQ